MILEKSAYAIESITNDYFVMAINGILFILFAIIFRKRTKKRIERSRYSD